jgi:hypothetical protein
MIFSDQREKPIGAARREDMQNPVHHLAYIYPPAVASRLGWANQRFAQPPLFWHQIAWIAQRIAVIPPPILDHPYRFFFWVPQNLPLQNITLFIYA